LFVLSILVMLIIFGNRMTLRFTLDKKGVLYEMIDTREKKLSTLVIILGLLLKKPVTVGSGLIAKSLESIFFDFKNVLKSDFNDNKKIVFLKNEWRTLLAIYCKDENYEDVKEFINNKIREKNKEFKIEKVKNPLLKYIILSLITILASIPIFTLQYPFEINLFLPILILFFMLGAIWLTRLISVVSIGGSIYVILFIIFKLFQKRESIFFNKSYFNYELISSEDIIMFIFLSLSLIYFIGFSIYMLKGKFVSMLERDYY
ncbi:MAG: hypothetical protein H5U37_04455, partial [Caldisericia bacterium]|nr:hypothetical protein [Caldisericia bacterium]